MKPRTILGLSLLLIAAISLIAYLVSLIIPSAFPEQVNNQIYLIVAISIGVAAFIAALNDITELISKLTARSSLDKKPPPSPNQTSPKSQVGDISNVESFEINIADGDITRADRIIGTQVVGDQYKAQTIVIQREGKETRVPLQLPPRPEHGLRGRDTELAQLLADLKPNTIVTICGPGGIGKTALASEAIWQLTENGSRPPDLFPDGVLFHTFYNQPSSDVALEAIALAYGLEPRPTPLAAAQIALSNRCALLVLDGAEAADDLKKVLGVRGCGAVLVTSRDRADWVASGQDISPLETEHSLTLLKDWGGDQIVDDEAAHRICELVGNLPLAVMLAGSYLAVNKENISTYTQWLESLPLSALNHGERRSASVPVLLERSLEAVGEDAKNALAVIGLLALAPFNPLYISTALDLPQDRAGRALNELVRFGLLLRSENWYQVSHALVHTFSRHRLAPPDGTLERLADHYIQLAQVMREKGLEGFQELDEVRPHLITLLEGLKVNEHWKTILTLSWSVEKYLDLQGRWQERLLLSQYALDASHVLGDMNLISEWLNKIGITNYYLAQFKKSIDYLEQALEIAQETGDYRMEGNIDGNLGNAYAALGQVERAIEYHQQALQISQEIGDSRSEGSDLGNLGNAYADLGQVERAIEYHEQALVISKEIGDRRGEGSDLGNLGNAYADLGQVERAIEYYQQALEIAQEIGDRHGEGNRLGSLGNAYFSLGQVERAIEYYQQALQIAQEIGDRRGEGTCLGNLGNAYHALGQVERAIECYQQALQISQEIGDRRGEGNHLGNLGLAYADLGQVERAIKYHEQSLVISKEDGNRRGEAIHLYNLGNLYQEEGDQYRAREMYEQSLEIEEKILPSDHPSIQQTKEAIHSLEDRSS